MAQDPDSEPSRPLVIGHRGAPGYRPEHSEASYRLALTSGVDAVEPDVVISKDGVLVVRHENEISGTTDVAAHPEFSDRKRHKTVDGERVTGWFVEDFTWEELTTLRTRERLPKLRPDNARFDGQEPILRLSDVLGLIDAEEQRSGRQTMAVIELKHPTFLESQGFDLVALLAAELKDCGWADREDQLIVECFELSALDRVRELGVPARRVFLLEHPGSPADELAEQARSGVPAKSYEWYRSAEGLDSLRGRVDGISPAKRDILSDDNPETGLVARAHDRGLTVFTWTLRPENRFLDPIHRIAKDPAKWGDWRAEWRRLISAGVDGVFVDHPDLLKKLN